MRIKAEDEPKMLISIIIATFNRGNFIEQTLKSLLDQTYSNFEIIIVDDGGTDNTKNVLRPYLEKDNISFYRRSKEFLKGCPGSRNYGITIAKGEYIWFFDDDDIAHPKLLQTCVDQLKNNYHDFCRFKRSVFYDYNKISFDNASHPEIENVSKENLKQLVIGELPFNSCQVIWRKAILDKYKFREDIIYADDYEFYSRLLAKDLKGVTVNMTLLYARKHAGSATHKYKNMNKRILQSVTKANKSVINLCIREHIMDKQLFKFFFRQAITFNSYPILEELLSKTDTNFSKKLKYKLGYTLYPVIRPIFKLKSKFLKL